MAYFITGTGTDVGKTFFTCKMIRARRALGKPIHAIKPVISGFDEKHIKDTDCGKILLALGKAIHIDHVHSISPWRFKAPLSPDMAAAREGVNPDFDEIVNWCKLQQKQHAALLIEGAGGVMSPITGSHTCLDLIKTLDIPAILLCGNYLGAISHTLTAVQAIKAAHVKLPLIVINEIGDHPVPSEQMVNSLRVHLGTDVKIHIQPHISKEVDDTNPILPQEIINLLDAV